MRFTKIVNSGPPGSLHEGVVFVFDSGLVIVLVISNEVSFYDNTEFDVSRIVIRQEL